MAKTLDHYEGVVQGNPPIYVYEKHDDTSEPTRVYKGDLVKLPTWYAEEINNSMYRVTYPENGWMFWWNVGNIKPAYVTTTDKCTPPTAVKLDATKKVLTIEGGAGGDLNAFKGFGVSYRERSIDSTAWGKWSSDTVITGRSMTVNVSAKKVRQYRVRTRGSAGSSYFSAYVTCATLAVGNTAPGTPVITMPQTGAFTYSQEPRVFVTVSADPDGDTMKLMRKTDDGEWVERAQISIAEGNEQIKDDLFDVEFGAHTIYYKVVDANGAETGAASVRLTMEMAEWTREINSGDVIANKEISHVKDIEEMLEKLNVVRKYYNLPGIVLPGTVGRFADWRSQMVAMLEGLNEISQLTDSIEFGTEQVPDWPEASTILMIRFGITES